MGSGALVGGSVALGSAGVGGLGMDSEVGRGETTVGSGVACPNPSQPSRNKENSSRTAIKRNRKTHIRQLSTSQQNYESNPQIRQARDVHSRTMKQKLRPLKQGLQLPSRCLPRLIFGLLLAMLRLAYFRLPVACFCGTFSCLCG